tara:strand:- start:5473 stop:5751 length:279 start_codon:yes stop_codon:yes gene_type:complete
MRYKSNIIRKDKDGTRYYRPNIARGIPLKDTDKFIFPFDGDRLDIIAYRFYGDAKLWWIIANANKISNGQIGLDPNKKIRVPIEIQDILDKL